MASKPVIIIPVSSRDWLTHHCIESIVQNTTDYFLHCAITQKTEIGTYILSRSDYATYDPHTPFNFSRVVNQAMARYPDSDIVLLNNDTRVTAGWLEALGKAAGARGGLIGARTDKMCCGNPDLWRSDADDTKTKETLFPINMFCAYIPLRTRRLVGNLDERFTAYGGEDCDYSVRVLKAGLPLIVSGAYVEHNKGKESFGPNAEELQKAGQRIFSEKWPGVPPVGPYKRENAPPLVSVVIAAYNEEKHIDQALESIQDQDYKNLEIIVVDDGSTDETSWRVACRKNDRRIILVDQKHAGPAAAKNYGVLLAKGDFIAFQDADDISDLSRISKSLEEFRKDAELDILYTDVNETADMVKMKPFSTGPLDVEKMLNFRQWVAGATFVMRRGIWDMVGPFDLRWPCAHDYEWLLRAYEKRFRIAFLPEKLYFYRRHANNTAGGKNAAAHHREIAKIYGEKLLAETR